MSICYRLFEAGKWYVHRLIIKGKDNRILDPLGSTFALMPVSCGFVKH